MILMIKLERYPGRAVYVTRRGVEVWVQARHGTGHKSGQLSELNTQLLINVRRTPNGVSRYLDTEKPDEGRV